MNQNREEFGTQRLSNTLSHLAGKSSQQIVEGVKTSLTEFVNGAEQHDDITMLVLKRM
jgi:serine phosphatase RsbU (regulator of sigma subunit)